jgi:hypothetical protein
MLENVGQRFHGNLLSARIGGGEMMNAAIGSEATPAANRRNFHGCRRLSLRKIERYSNMRRIIIASIAAFGVAMSFGGIAQAAGVTVQLGHDHHRPPVVVEHSDRYDHDSYHHHHHHHHRHHDDCVVKKTVKHHHGKTVMKTERKCD